MPIFTNPKTNMQIFTFLRNACNRKPKAELLQIEGAKNPNVTSLCSSGSLRMFQEGEKYGRCEKAIMETSRESDWQIKFCCYYCW